MRLLINVFLPAAEGGYSHKDFSMCVSAVATDAYTRVRMYLGSNMRFKINFTLHISLLTFLGVSTTRFQLTGARIILSSRPQAVYLVLHHSKFVEASLPTQIV